MKTSFNLPDMKKINRSNLREMLARMGTVGWFLRYAVKFKKEYLLVIIIGCVSSAFTLVLPLIGKSVIDRSIIGNDMSALFKNGALGATILVITALLSIPQAWVRMRVSMLVSFALKKDLFRAIQRMPLNLFQEQSSGEYYFRGTSDIDAILGVLNMLTEQLIITAVMTLVTIYFMFKLDVLMSVLILVVSAVAMIKSSWLNRYRRSLNDTTTTFSRKILNRLREAFSHFYLVKALKMEGIEINTFLHGIIASMRLQIQAWRMDTWNQKFLKGIDGLLFGTIILVGAYRTSHKDISPGVMTALLMYLNQLNNNSTRLIEFLRSAYMNSSHASRLRELLQNNKTKKCPSKTVEFARNQIDLRGVSFGYLPGQNILNNISLQIKPGIVGFAGASGCGKTTTLNLILGLINPRKGSISIDDVSVEEISDDSFRSQVGVSLQNAFLWNDSIEANIRYSRPAATPEEIRQAATLAGVDEFVGDFPGGYETVLGDDACKISEGQKQKISIARALLRRPKILILDESMSAMDSKNEHHIVQGIRSMKIPLVILVSHRLSSILACDNIFFFKSPDTIVEGNPRDLLEKDRDFRLLFNAQIFEKK